MNCDICGKTGTLPDPEVFEIGATYSLKVVSCVSCGTHYVVCIHCLTSAYMPCKKCGSALIIAPYVSPIFSKFPNNLFAMIEKGFDGVFMESLDVGNVKLAEIDSFRDEKGFSLLAQAALKKEVKLCESLIKAGADPCLKLNIANYPAGMTGMTALMLMVDHRSWSLQIAKLLRKSINIRDDYYGYTAIMYALPNKSDNERLEGHSKIVKDLIELGADLSLTAKDRRRALEIAKDNSKLPMFDTIIEALTNEMIAKKIPL